MISIGPTMQHVYSPQDALSHPSVPQTYELLEAVPNAIHYTAHRVSDRRRIGEKRQDIRNED